MSGSEPAGASDSVRDLLHRSLGGTYRIERELGGGGMSRVFLAEERALGRRVVVKVLAPELAHEVSAERFAREIRLSAQLQHPNIVPMLAAGTMADVPYYTMPFIDGESLRTRLARLGPGERLPVAEAIAVLRDVARALAYAHGLGVVHRDIKPENILLGYDAAVVADFGVAKALSAATIRQSDGPGAHAGATGTPLPPLATLTRAGVALGTPAYMSPEQAAGDPGVDHRADVYAWGTIAYELLAGAHPFAGRQSVQALVAAHLVEQPRSLADVAPHVPHAVASVVMRCLAKSPGARPDSARELAETLGIALGTEPATARDAAATRTAPPRKPSVRWPSRTVVVAGALVIALGTAAAALAWRARGARAQLGGPTLHVSSDSPGYDAYLRGKVRVSSENPQDTDAAITALRQAIAADPAFAPAYATLARAYTIKAFYFAPDSETKGLNEDAEVAVAKALALDPKLAEAHFAQGLMLWTPARRFPHEQAVSAYRQALALDSTLDEAHHQLALVYFHVGLLDEAKTELDQALAINPGNTLARFRLGVIDMYRGQYEGAYAIFNTTPLERSPTLWAFQTATALYRLGRDNDAVALLDRFLRDYPKDEGGVGHSVRAMMFAKAGRRDAAEAEIATALELGRNFGHFHHSAYNIASAYALLGDREKAIRRLQEAADNGFPCYPLFATDTQLDGLRGDPRFVALMTNLRRDWEERKRTLGH